MNGLHERYTLPQMYYTWREENRLDNWFKVELAALQARADMGELPQAAVDAIRKHARINVLRMKQIEEETRHDVIAFVKMLQESLKGTEAEPYADEIHKPLTSYDIVDPAMVLQLREACGHIKDELRTAIGSIEKRAREHQWSYMIAYTHVQYAEPTTFGHLLRVYGEQLSRCARRLSYCLDYELVEGKMSGAVGNYAGPSPELEKRALHILGLTPAMAETQILQRDRIAAVLCTLAITARSIEHFARTLHGMMRSSIRELEEPRGEKQRGSSRMAYKKNPILTEQLIGIARLVSADAATALEDIPTLDFRTIEQSCVERHILPRSTAYTYYLLTKFTYLIQNLVVYPDRMRQNLDKAGGIWASNPVRDALMEAGYSYDQAYLYLQKLGFRVAAEGVSLEELLRTEPIDDIPFGEPDLRTAEDVLGRDLLHSFFDVRAYLERGITYLFQRPNL